MSRTIGTPRHMALAAYLKRKRKEAGLTQADVAKRLKRYQSFVTDYERGQKNVDAVLLVEIAEVVGFDPKEAIGTIQRVRTRG